VTILASPRVSQSIGACVGWSQGVVQLAIGKQPASDVIAEPRKLKHQAAVEIEPQSTPIRFTLRVPVERDHGFRSKMITQSGGR